MARRLALGLLLSFIVALPAALSTPSAHADRLSSLQAKIAAAQAREAELSSEIGSIEGRIRTLEQQVGGVSAQLETLERDLALQQEKLDRITSLFDLQTEQLDFLKHEYSVCARRAQPAADRPLRVRRSDDARRLALDREPERLPRPDRLRPATSARRTSRITTQVNTAKVRMHAAREKTKVTRHKVATVTRTIAVRTAQVRSEKERLLISEKGLAKAKGHKKEQLASIQQSKEEYLHEVAGLQASYGAVSAQIQASGSSTYDSTPSASGLIWPVSGPVVSPFGMRWGRLHAGIDIGVGYGTPIHASASGTVIFAGWMGGYGNFVIVDHGGGLSTGYAHQSSIAVGGGSVSQGQVIGYVGCTGHCFGPHLHFEVRINGSPVDPLGYL